MAGGDSSGRSLENTPTWALAAVCLGMISISIIIEHSIHLLIHWLKRRRKNGLIDALHKLKSELMLLGFMSLILAGTQNSTSKICIPTNTADIMLPCRQPAESQSLNIQSYEHIASKTYRNLSFIDESSEHILWNQQNRRLADEEDDETAANNDTGSVSDSDFCTSKGKVALISKDGIHQLHIFIFVLAVMQIVYSVLTMALGRLKMRRWKAWEKETRTTEYLVANDPERFRLTRQTTFGRRHVNSCTETSVQLWTKCFFRQFFHSLAKVDYLTLRHGFISAHMSSASASYNPFNFQKYIKRTLEEDFKLVIGISPFMWFFVVIVLLVNVHGWHVYLWISYVPLLIVLILGTKLESIVAKMALQINDRTTVIKGTPLVQPSDKLFWFGRPRLVLFLLHFTLFMNAFELAFFIWVSIEFGVDSCYHEHTAVTVTRVVLAIVVQVLCSYITLPLYAIVTQMGSEFKSRVLEEQTAKIIKQWHAEVRERRKKQEQSVQSTRTSLSTNEYWNSTRGSLTDRSSLPKPTSMANESNIHFNNQKGEITEEEEVVAVNNNEEEETSSMAPPSTFMVEMQTVRRQ